MEAGECGGLLRRSWAPQRPAEDGACLEYVLTFLSDVSSQPKQQDVEGRQGEDRLFRRLLLALPPLTAASHPSLGTTPPSQATGREMDQQHDSLKAELESLKATSTRQSIQAEQALHELATKLSAVESQLAQEQERSRLAAEAQEREKSRAVELKQQLDRKSVV